MTATICGVFEADPGTDKAKKLLEEVRIKNLREKKIVSSDGNSLLNVIADPQMIIGNATDIILMNIKA